MGRWTEALSGTRSTVWTCSKPKLKSVCPTMSLQSECLMKVTGKAGVLVRKWRWELGKLNVVGSVPAEKVSLCGVIGKPSISYT